MRDWKFQLTSQLVRGSWFIEPNYGQAGLIEVANLLNPNRDFSSLNTDILSVTNPYSLIAATTDDDEVTSGYDSLPKGSIALFQMSGTLLKYGTLCSYGTEEIGEMMVAAANHENIDGMLLIGDSGGGAVNSVAPVRRGFNAFKQLGKATGALMDTACSAMYYGISQADFIMASNDISAVFGSWGVAFNYLDVKAALEKQGIIPVSIYPEESSEKNLAFRELFENDNRELFAKEELSPLAIQFRNTMISDRGPKLKLESDPKMLLGKTYNAVNSLKNGMIDAIGDKEKAIERLFAQIEVNKFLKSN